MIYNKSPIDLYKTEEHISETSETEDGSETLESEDNLDIDE